MQTKTRDKKEIQFNEIKGIRKKVSSSADKKRT
jgi:hypothetical protein